MDVYSYGVLLAECLSSERPYAGMDAMQIAFATVYRNKRPNLPSSIPQPLEKLVKVCWEADPKKRPPFSRILDSLRAIERTMERSSAGGAASAGPSRAGPSAEGSRIPRPPPRKSNATNPSNPSPERRRSATMPRPGGGPLRCRQRVMFFTEQSQALGLVFFFV